MARILHKKGDDMRIEQLRYLQEIEKYRSLSKASEHLFITQPTLSRSIKALEDELGCELLVRNSSGVQLTAAANNLLPTIEDILTRIHFLKQQAKVQSVSQLDFSEFTLQILTTAGIVDAYLIDVLNQFYKLYPMCTIRIDVIEMKDIQKISEISDAQIIILKIMPDCSLFSYLSLDNVLVDFQKIFKEPQVCVMRRDAKLASQKYLLPEQAYAQKLVLNLSGVDMLSLAKRIKGSKQELDILLRSNDESVIKSTILSQDAMYLTNMRLVQKYKFSEEEYSVLPYYFSENMPLNIDIYAIFKNNSLLFPWIQSFLDILSATCIAKEA